MPHPLFDTDREITAISITRFERGGQVWCPRQFDPTEIDSLEPIHASFGGGSYELIAYGVIEGTKGKVKRGIVDRKKFQLPGPSIPFPGTEPAPSVAPVALPAGDSSAQIMQLMMQQGQQNMQLMMQLMQHQSAQTTQILTALISKGGGGTEAALQAVTELAKLHVQRPSESGGLALEKALELGHRLGAAEAMADAGDEEGGSDIETFLGGAVKFHEMFKSGGGGNEKPN